MSFNIDVGVAINDIQCLKILFSEISGGAVKCVAN